MYRLLLLPLFVLLAFPSPSYSSQRVYIDVGEAKVKKSLVALPPLQFFSSSKSKKNLALGQELFNVIMNDLTVSSLFTFINQSAFLEDTSKVGLKPAPGSPGGFNYNSWKTIGTEFLIRGGYTVIGDDVSFEVYVYYVPHASQVFGGKYNSKVKGIRKVAHKFSDDLLKNLTGKRGMFTTRLVATKKGSTAKSEKEVYIMDWDGKNQKKITRHGLAISPAWSPDGNLLAYTAYNVHRRGGKNLGRNADLYTYNINTGKRFVVSYSKGINSGATFSPDGRSLILTKTNNGKGADLFKMNINGKNLKRLTRGPHGAMNLEPSISPDGRKIAFSSDRSGRPMIYVMNMNGKGLRKLTHAGRYNSSPNWSPDGKKIVFSSLDFKKKAFDIFVISADGAGLERLTSARKKNGKWSNNDDPAFSPDGRHIVFVSDRSGRKQLYLINPDGTNERRITFDSSYYEKPQWSPYMD